MELNLIIVVETRRGVVSLEIDHDELKQPKNTCIFRIIKKLLKI